MLTETLKSKGKASSDQHISCNTVEYFSKHCVTHNATSHQKLIKSILS